MIFKKGLRVLIFMIAFCAGFILLSVVQVLDKLPSSLEIKKNLFSAQSPQKGRKTVNTNQIEVRKNINSIQGRSGDFVSEHAILSDHESTMKSITQEFLDPSRPLADVCRNLSKVSDSRLELAAGQDKLIYFYDSLLLSTGNPHSEVLAPVLRYIFRAPGMRSVSEMILNAEEGSDQNVFKKIEFYYEFFRAGNYLHSHQIQINALLQKTYNLFFLIKGIAEKPGLAADSATFQFCQQIEQTINDEGPYSADAAAQEMLQYFSDVGIDAKNLGYDPKYRSKVSISFDKTQISVNDTWVADLFAQDSL